MVTMEVFKIKGMKTRISYNTFMHSIMTYTNMEVHFLPEDIKFNTKEFVEYVENNITL